ncbi:MAG: hypothetical protein E7373_06585 [Clostridiales bacterium]|nr:hypothetical protein [Clostridiales bacterium]
MEFPKGIYTDTFHGDYGDIINMSIHVDKIKENPVSDKGYIKIQIKKSKEKNEWYAVLNEYKKG